ncbi:hypothetical protein BD770DRAFT_393423 [Pilaira anomala]|nr:hypothetical protein BD770DRAFT_393423 [Pilaira anomala]
MSSSSYWYSRNGLDQRRLSHRHLSILDQAFERHARIQLFDDEVFGQNVIAIANPYQGTLTAGDLHFGLYRQPPMWRMSDTSLDTLILMDSYHHSQIDETTTTNSKNRHSNGDATSLDTNTIIINNNNSPRDVTTQSTKYKYNSHRKKNSQKEEHCICCRIS